MVKSSFFVSSSFDLKTASEDTGDEQKSETKMDIVRQNVNDSDAQFGNLVANFLRESNLSMVQKLALQGEILGLIASKIKWFQC